MRNSVVKYIQEFNLVQPGQSVLVALSGGPDSVAMLHLFCSMRKSWKLRVGAVHLNHNIRKRGAKADQRFCERLCASLGVEIFVETRDVPALAQEWKMSLEEASRKCRYDLFEAVASANKFASVALGHHRHDQAETVLFRIIRGTGRTGLLGMSPKRGIYIRPLLSVSRDAIKQYLQVHGLEYRVDRSNTDNRFARNYIRNRLVPLIERNLNPSILSQLNELADTLRPEEEFLDSLAGSEMSRTVRRMPSGRMEADTDRLEAMEVWLLRRVVRYCLAQLSVGGQVPAKRTVDRVIDAVKAKRPQLSLPNGMRAIVAGGKLYLASRTKVAFNKKLEIGGDTEIDRLGTLFRAREECGENLDLVRVRRSQKATLSKEKLQPPLLVRSLKPGDRFRPLGMSGSKKIGDYLTDRKVPVILREEIPVVCDRKGIVWLVGYEIAERVKIDNNTKEALTIEYISTGRGANIAV